MKPKTVKETPEGGLSIRALFALVGEKQERIKTLRAEIKSLREDLARIKDEERALHKRAAEESERANVEALGLGGEWLLLPETGITAREIIALQHVVSGSPLRKLGEQMGVTPGRAREIREKALRKLRHPKRIGLVANFDRELYRAVYGEYPANARAMTPSENENENE
jgi:DNA-directed RNA polymerase sigma subunit (sigma70/sigma32)